MFCRVLDQFCVSRKSRPSNIREGPKEKAYILYILNGGIDTLACCFFFTDVFFKQSFHEEKVTNFYVPYHRIYRSTELRPFSAHPFIV